MRTRAFISLLVASIAVMAMEVSTWATNITPNNTQYDGQGCGNQIIVLLPASADTIVDFGCAVTTVSAWHMPLSTSAVCSIAVGGENAVVQMTKGTGVASARAGAQKQPISYIPLTTDVFSVHTTINKGLAYRYARFKTTAADTVILRWDTDQ